MKLFKRKGVKAQRKSSTQKEVCCLWSGQYPRTDSLSRVTGWNLLAGGPSGNSHWDAPNYRPGSALGLNSVSTMGSSRRALTDRRRFEVAEGVCKQVKWDLPLTTHCPQVSKAHRLDGLAPVLYLSQNYNQVHSYRLNQNYVKHF